MKLRALQRLVVALLFAAGTCAADETATYRLPAGVAPTSQQIELNVDPGRPDFEGSTTISLRVDETVGRIGIHQIGLDMTRIVLGSGGELRPLTAEKAEYAINWLSDGEPIEAGEYTLFIEYSGSFPREPLGMHRVRFEERDYVFTQFQAMHARKAIPVFDEPGFKIPFQLTINAPEQLAVVSNTPVANRTVADGMQRVEFNETPPMPSYLIAYAVGPLDRAPIEGLSVPGFVYTPAGHADETGFVRRETPAILDWFEAYFGREYPYEKLDFVAVPDYAFGGMENVGLVTYRSEYMLLGDEASGRTAEIVLYIIGHELAHMWFGNLVTLAWWNDMWLNEAFPSWLSAHMMEGLYPEYGSVLKLPQQGAFRADRRMTAKPIRKTVRTEAELLEDLGLNYNKGAALLRMLETWVGPETWRAGVRKYVDRHAWGNTVETDLWAAIGEAAKQDIGAIAGAYINQPGFALLTFDAKGRVSQQRFGAKGAAARVEWQVPLTMRYLRDGKTFETSYLLDGKKGQLDVPDDVDWLFPDVGGQGYFRWQIEEDQFDALVADIDTLSDREKIALLDNTDALLGTAHTSMDDYLAVIDALLANPEPLVVLPALEKLKTIGDTFIDADSAAAFARLVDTRLAARLEAIGSERQPGDSEATIQLRPRLLRILGQYGADATVGDMAAGLAARYLDGDESVDTGLAIEALRMAAMADDGNRFQQYIDAYRSSGSVEKRNTILAAMYFRESEQIHEYFDFLLTPDVSAGDVILGLYYLPDIIEDHSPLYEWLEDNFDAYVAKLPDNYEPQLPQVLAGKCTAENRERLADFFAERGAIYQASLAKALETIDGCLARKASHKKALLAYLERASAG